MIRVPGSSIEKSMEENGPLWRLDDGCFRLRRVAAPNTFQPNGGFFVEKQPIGRMTNT